MALELAARPEPGSQRREISRMEKCGRKQFQATGLAGAKGAGVTGQGQSANSGVEVGRHGPPAKGVYFRQWEPLARFVCFSLRTTSNIFCDAGRARHLAKDFV